MNSDQRQSFGKSGEDLACQELQRRGYAILARGYRSRFGEIDIIAKDDETIVFIEVKTGPWAALSPRERLVRDAVEAGRVRFLEVRIDSADRI